MSTRTLVTAEQLLRMPRGRCRHELVEGRLRELPLNGWRHGVVVATLDSLLGRHVREHGLGLALAPCGFLLSPDPDTVLAPDVAFIRRDRLAAASPKDAYWPGPPDLAVEVLSPGDTVNEVHEKALAWLDAGAAQVWVVNPAWRTVTLYRSAADIRTLTEPNELTAPDLLPGFRCRIADVFASP